jgi:hypothetical protein
MSTGTTSGADESPVPGIVADADPPDPDALEDAQDESSRPVEGRRRRRRVLIVGGVISGAVLIIGVLWLVVTALIARSELQQARGELPELRAAILAGDTAKAESLAQDIRHQADRAQWLVSGPAWWVGAHLPYVGIPLKTSQALASAVHQTTVGVLPELIDISATIENPSLRHGSGVDLALLQRLQPPTRRAASAVAAASASVAAAPHHSWLASADNARDALAEQLNQLGQYLSGAQRTLRVALPLLGRDAPQRIFVAFENEAEARGIGGLPAAFGVIETDHGQVRFAHFGNDTELASATASVNLGPGYETSYGQADPRGTFRNSDISPNFPSAARIWAGMWEDHSGQHVDAAIAIDPTALGYLLDATGPAIAADGTKVTGKNVVSLTESEQYAKFSDRAQRQAWVVSVAHAVANRILPRDGV